MLKNTIEVLVTTAQGPQYVDKESELYESIIEMVKDRKDLRNVLLVFSDSKGYLLYNVPLIPINIQ